MGHDEDKVKVSCCPRCKRLIQARDYMNPAVVGMLDSILPMIYCKCGYEGLPISMTQKDYMKWRKSG
ncbi:MAG: hypothetical protein V1827_02125 [Candidatus Micrarchaeota archaeon]